MLGLIPLLLIGVALSLAAAVGLLLHALRHPRRRGYAWALAGGGPSDPSDLGTAITKRSTSPDATGKVSPAWLIEGREARGPLVVLVHGYAACRYALLRHADVLCNHASRVLLIDLRSHGDSTNAVSTGGVEEPRDVWRRHRATRRGPGDAGGARRHVDGGRGGARRRDG